MKNFLSIGELSRLSGLSTHTIRFYESAGVLKPTTRAPNGHRRYLHADVLWLEFVLRLKKTGMPLSEIKQYAELRAQGENTVPSRLTMLEEHRKHLTQKLHELSVCASALDEKIQIYRNMLMQMPLSVTTQRTKNEPNKPN